MPSPLTNSFPCGFFIDHIVTRQLIVHLSLYTSLKPTCDKKVGIMGLVYIFGQRAFNKRKNLYQVALLSTFYKGDHGGLIIQYIEAWEEDVEYAF